MERTHMSGRFWMLGSFLRLPLVGWSLAMPLFGVLSVPDGVNRRALVPILMVIPFHIVLGVVNDLATVDLDKRDPRKVGRPLVSGYVTPTTAKALVLAAVLAAFPTDVVLLGPDPLRSVVLLVAFLATAAYNIAGKRSRVPPLMDFLLGVGSAAFVHYAMLAVSGATTSTGLLVEAAVIVYVTLDNGVHFGVRDIKADFDYEARTTPILFGARPRQGQAPYLPLTFVLYACSLQVLLTIITLGPVLVGLTRGDIGWAAVIVALLFVIGSYSTIYPAMNGPSESSRYLSAYLQTLSACGSIAVVAGATHGAHVVVGLFAVVTVPLFAHHTATASRALTIALRQSRMRRRDAGSVVQEPGRLEV